MSDKLKNLAKRKALFLNRQRIMRGWKDLTDDERNLLRPSLGEELAGMLDEPLSMRLNVSQN